MPWKDWYLPGHTVQHTTWRCRGRTDTFQDTQDWGRCIFHESIQIFLYINCRTTDQVPFMTWCVPHVCIIWKLNSIIESRFNYLSHSIFHSVCFIHMHAHHGTPSGRCCSAIPIFGLLSYIKTLWMVFYFIYRFYALYCVLFARTHRSTPAQPDWIDELEKHE